MLRVMKLFQALTPSSESIIRSHPRLKQCRPLASAFIPTAAQMDRVIVKSIPGDPNLTISLTVGGRQRNFDRPKAEPLGKPLARLQKAAEPPVSDKKKKKQKNQEQTKEEKTNDCNSSAVTGSPFIGLHAGASLDHPLVDPASTTNEDAWQHGRILRVGNISYFVELNPPSIERVSTLHATAFVGIPVVPVVDGIHCADPKECQWQWWRRTLPSIATGQKQRSVHEDDDAGYETGNRKKSTSFARNKEIVKEDDGTWQIIPGAVQRGYTPRLADAGCILRVSCTPTRAEITSSSPAPAAMSNNCTIINNCSSVADRGGDGDRTTSNASMAMVLQTPTPTLLVRSGEPVSAEVGPVTLPPSPDAASGRSRLTASQTSPPDVRIVTYNLLADQYASTEAAKKVLFKSCPLQYLEPSYRRPLILGELLQYHPDIACLQEVDEKMFSMYLEPGLAEEGFQGAYTNKAGEVREGSAVFWRRDRYSLAHRRDVVLKELFPSTPDPTAINTAKYGPPLKDMLGSSPALCIALQRVATVAQIVVLEPTLPGLRPVCLVNTHLFFHYAAPHIRTIHVWAILQEAHEVITAFARTHDSNLVEVSPSAANAASGSGRHRPALIFCGDLNSDLNDGIPGSIELLSRGKVSAGHWDWAFGIDFKWDRSEKEGGEEGEVDKMMHTEVEGLRAGSLQSQTCEIVPGVDLEAPFALAAADNLQTECTNYVQGYQGLLDYVWFERAALEVKKMFPVPSIAELGGYIPSRRFPSDHLAVVVDLRFRKNSPPSGDDAPPCHHELNHHPVSTSPTEYNEAGSARNSGSLLLPAALFNVGVAVEALKRGALLVVPTDTLYGLAVCAKNADAISRIYQAKCRVEHKPVAVCVADPKDVGRYVDVSHLHKGLLEDLLPGPVTLLLPRLMNAPLAATLNPGVSALGVRIPRNQFLRAVCRQHIGALALTSANLSGQRSPLSVTEVDDVREGCGLVFDAGTLGDSRLGSTIVDLTEPGEFRITRRGGALKETVDILEGRYRLRWVEAEGGGDGTSA